MKEYYKKFDKYADERHRNALDLNFKYIDGNRYELPSNWGKEGIIVDLSTTGREQLQIVKSVCVQLIAMYDSLEFSASLLQQQIELGLPDNGS